MSQAVALEVRVSDARPITNITDYVCGSCWNSFSRTDPGVEQGDHLVCPHCGHALPDGASGDLTAAVRGAAATAHADSDTFEVSAPAGDSANARPTTTKIAATRASADQGFPELDAANPYGWLPPDMPAGPSLKRDSDGSYVIGDADDFGFDEPTLRPDRNHADLMALVRAAPSRPLSDPGTPFVAGDEMGIDTEEPTPLEIDGRSMVAADPGEFDAEFGPVAANDLQAPPSYAEADAEPDAIDDYEHRDWKLKAMGLTYNFHGLDALVNWASNKAGQTMAVSSDGGAKWKDFHWFFDGMKNGLPAAKAYELALPPGSPPPAASPTTPRMSPVVKGGVAAPELQLGKPGDEKSPQPGNLDAGLALGAPSMSASAVPAAGSLGGVAGSSSRQPLQRVGPTTSPSRRMPVAARQPVQEASNPVKIAAVIAVIAVVVAALLHLQGVLKIPGLH